MFNKIDLRIDGIPEKAILQDEKQMKDISEVIQKLEESKVDLGENSNQEDYIYTEEMPKRFRTKALSNLLNYDKRQQPFNVKRAGNISLME